MADTIENLRTLKSVRGRGTELISVYLPPDTHPDQAAN